MNAFQQKLSGVLTLGLIGMAAFFALADPAQPTVAELNTAMVDSAVVESAVADEWEFTARSRTNRCRFSTPSP